MSGPAEIWQQSADSFEAKLAQVGDDQWELPTGCGWTVRELVDHVVYWQANLGKALGASTSADDGWEQVKQTVAEALADPSNLEGQAAGGDVPMPRHQVLGFATADVLLHGWDLARAVGLDDSLPPEAVSAVLMGMSQVPDTILRQPNVFGPAVAVGDDASEQDKLVAFSGRRP